MFAAAILLTPLLIQDPDDLQRVREAERRRVQTVAEVSAAVCAVMPMDRSGGGSGVVIDAAGFVLTNFHVVRPPADVLERLRQEMGGVVTYPPMKIGLPDGRLYRAEVLGVDPGSDLALLDLGPREDGQPWPHVSLGDSDRLLVGETVFAMGNPFMLATDFTPTVTWGIVSGTHRYLPGGGNRMGVYPDCIQVDAPINPGNSGGPLFNDLGEVVGINGRISVSERGRVSVGVGFAIASNQIRNFLGDLMAGRHAEHGTLDMNAWFMNSPVENRRGVFVQSIFQDSRVADAGVGLGDEIISFNGEEVRSANQLATLVGVLPEKSWVALGYRPQLRDGGYGPAKVVHLQIPRLDTGSSRDPDRIASREQRRRAAAALGRPFGAGQESTAGATLELVTTNGERIVFHRLGDRLSLTLDQTRLVLAGIDGFKVVDGVVQDLTAEDRARLERELATNPWLWTGPERQRLIGEALLAGGVLVHGRPAYRFELSGDGQREIYVFADGSPAGYQLRDPLARVLVEVRVDFDPQGNVAFPLRMVFDDELQPGGELLPPVYDPPPGEELFRRPGR